MRTLFAALSLLVEVGCSTPQRQGSVQSGLADPPSGSLRVQVSWKAVPKETRERISKAIETAIKADRELLPPDASRVLTIQLESDPPPAPSCYRVRAVLLNGRTGGVDAIAEERCAPCNVAVITEQLCNLTKRLLNNVQDLPPLTPTAP